MTREALLREVLKLPHRERADMAVEVLASLEEEPAEDAAEVEKAWAVEIERRARRVLAGVNLPSSPSSGGEGGSERSC